MTQFEAVITNTDTVWEHLTDFSDYSAKITLMVAFALGIYVLLKATSLKRLHRKGVEHGSARWANEKEERNNSPHSQLCAETRFSNSGFLPTD